MARNVYLDQGAEAIIERVMEQLGPGATPSEAVRYLASMARKYDELAAQRNREKRLMSG